MVSIKQFNTREIMLSREKKIPEGKDLAYIILFGLLYCLDLYVYIGYKAVFSPILKKADNQYIVNAEVGGMVLLLFLFLITFIVNKINFKIPIRNLFWVCFGLQVTLAFVTPSIMSLITPSAISMESLKTLCLFRFIEAIVVSINLAIYLSVIGRNIGRKKRTWAATIVFSIGFLGPFFVNFIREFTENENTYLFMVLPSVAVLYALFVWKKYGTDDIFSKTYPNKKDKISDEDKDNDKFEINADIRAVLYKGNFWKSVYVLFICGLSVLFTVRFVLQHSEIFTNDTEFKEYIYMMRYLGSTIGVLFFGWFSVSFSKKYYHFGMYQIRLGERKIVFQMGMLFGILALLGFQNFAYCSAIFPPSKYIIPLFLGVSNAIWCIVFLQTIETLGRKTQPILVFLLPIFLRVFWDLLSYEQLQKLVNPDGFTYVITYIGIFIYVIGFIVSILWEDNFEGGNRLDTYDYNFAKGRASSLMNKEVRENIAAIDTKIVRSENVEEYIAEVSIQVRHRFEEVFDTSLYYYNFIFLKERAEAFRSEVEIFNNSLEDLRKVRESSIRKLCKWLRVVVEKRNDKGLASYSFDKDYEGVILAGDKKYITPSLQASYEESNYKLFDLSKILLPDEQLIIDFWKHLSKMETEDFSNPAKIEETRQKFSPIYEFTRANFPKEDMAEHFPTEIQRLLTLRAIGAWCYPEGEYFIYLITPKDSKHKLKTSLLMATAAPIPIEKLNELRDLLDYVMLQKAYSMSLDTEWKKVAFRNSHALKTTIGSLIDRVNEYEEIEEKENKEKHKKLIVATLKYIDRVNILHLNLMRYQDNPESAKNSFIPENVNLHDVIKEVLSELRDATNNLNIEKEYRNLVKNLLNSMCEGKMGFEVGKDLNVKVLKTAFQVLLVEILKNAFENTNQEQPLVRILMIEKENCYHLNIINNILLKKEQIEKLNNNNVSGGIGLNTIKQILEFKQFNQYRVDASTLLKRMENEMTEEVSDKDKSQKNKKHKYTKNQVEAEARKYLWKKEYIRDEQNNSTIFQLTIPKQDVQCIKS